MTQVFGRELVGTGIWLQVNSFVGLFIDNQRGACRTALFKEGFEAKAPECV